MTQLNLSGRSLPYSSRNRLVFDMALEEAATMGRLPQDASAVLNTIKEALREEPPESLKDREGRFLANGWEPDEEFWQQHESARLESYEEHRMSRAEGETRRMEPPQDKFPTA